MIQLNNVTKLFKTDGAKKYILKNVTFTIPQGVNLGILGRNGAGKSTFLRMLGGIDFPTSGKITSDKSFSWPMGLAGGFQPSMTGRQNVKFVCRIYGKNNDEIKETIESVKKFSELGDYFDMPIKTYSSGMRSRLSFGMSLAFDFDYLIIDETLSVGDQNFKKKAKDALIQKIQNSNILLVSHAMEDLRKLCDAGVVLDNGVLSYFEDINDAIAFYHQLNLKKTSQTDNRPQSSAIYCDDGNIFDNIVKAATFYNVRPMSIVQALEQNQGSHIYLKKVFWRDGEVKNPFQLWENVVENETIISSDGMIFENEVEARSFYQERLPKVIIEEDHISHIMQTKKKFSNRLNVKLHYLNKFQGK